jgi:hypothetical protein
MLEQSFGLYREWIQSGFLSQRFELTPSAPPGSSKFSIAGGRSIIPMDTRSMTNDFLSVRGSGDGFSVKRAWPLKLRF